MIEWSIGKHIYQYRFNQISVFFCQIVAEDIVLHFLAFVADGSDGVKFVTLEGLDKGVSCMLENAVSFSFPNVEDSVVPRVN